MKTQIFFTAIIIAAAIAGGASGETFSVPIDAAQSSVTVTLTLLGQSAVDTSPVTGFVDLSLARVSDPRQVTGNNFHLSLTETLTLNISFGFLGAFNSTLQGLEIIYATPGTPIGPVAVSAGAFSFIGVPTNTDGVLNYNATGVVCGQLSSQGLPCTDTDDLSTEPTQNIDFDATLSASAGRTVTVIALIDRTAPVDPANPSLGTIRVQGTVRGVAFVPVIPGDANGDCIVNFVDIIAVLAAFGNAQVAGDANNDQRVDFLDVISVLGNWANSCG